MATTLPPIVVEEFLTPIAPDRPAGEYLRWDDDDYATIMEAREAEEDAKSLGDWERARKTARWDEVVLLGTDMLKARTKDLQVAGWVLEALTNLQGLTGLRDGLRLMLALQDAFWDTAHPESGDRELREGIIEFLDDDRRLPLLVRSVPLTQVRGVPGGLSWLKHKESRDVDNIIRGAGDRAAEREEEFKSEGKIRGEDFDKAVTATDREFYVALVATLAECQQAIQQVNDSLRAEGHFGKKGPTLSHTAAALEDVDKLAKQLLARKPAPEGEAPAEEEAPSDDQGWGEVPAGEVTEDGAAPEAAPARPRRRARPGPVSGDPRDVIVEAARQLRQADPNDPAGYLVPRALRLGELYALAADPTPGDLPPPPTEDRQALRRLASESDWPALLEAAEDVLARPEGRGWLDAHRLSAQALEALEHPGAARGARALLGALLRDFPTLPDAELDDGTPAAGAETRAWFDEAGLTARPEPAPYWASAPAPEPPAASADGSPAGEAPPPDAWDQAQQHLREGQPAQAIAGMARAVRDARTGRERFLRTLQQAELCLMLNRPAVAVPLLEDLVRQIDKFQLEQWEDVALCTRVFAAFYRCLRGGTDERAKAIYNRLCQLDIGQAMLIEEGS